MIISTIELIVAAVAVLWVAFVIIGTWYNLHYAEGIAFPPLVASTLLFVLGMVVLWWLGASPLHLLWWYPLSAIIGAALLIVSSTWANFNFLCLSLLAHIRPPDQPDGKP